MALSFWERITTKNRSVEAVSVASVHPFECNEDGVLYPYSSIHQSDADYYWKDLEQECVVYPTESHYVLPWGELFKLLKDEEHASVIHLLQIPTQTCVKPVINSRGALSDSSFGISLAGWKDESGSVKSNAEVERIGAVIALNGQKYLLAEASFELTKQIRKMARLGNEKTRQDNERYWGKIRKLANEAQAHMDSFLSKTIVLHPEALQLKMRQVHLANDSLIEIQPVFEGAPNNWLESFDQYNEVQSRYSVNLPDGGVVHVLIEDEVKQVLSEIKSMPARRVAGERAQKFIENPFAQLGDSAAQVINADDFERSKSTAGIFKYDLTIDSHYDEAGYFQSADLKLDPCTVQDEATLELPLNDANHASYFIENFNTAKIAEENQFYWNGYPIILSPKSIQQLERLRSDLAAIISKNGQELLQGIFNISAYSDRVIGVGEPPAGSVSNKSSGEAWLPTPQSEHFFDEIKPHITSSTLEDIQTAIEVASKAESSEVILPYIDHPVSMPTALDVEYRVKEFLQKRQPTEKDSSDKPNDKPAILLVKSNIDDEEYIHNRGELLKLDLLASPTLPSSFRSQEFQLKPHQHYGIAWLQHLFSLAPEQVNGCLLADDMGLGKTIQLLCFIGQYLEANKGNRKPVLIVAPVSLLENWQAEANKFFSSKFGKILSLYGEQLKQRKMRDVPVNSQGIKNLLIQDWRGEADIVLTTYETLRDLQFSLGKEHWSMMICDEAQKIKTPSALVTRAALAMNADFKIACTGTPVENSLTDLWCLFDFIQSGLLGSLKEFNKVYKRPIEDDEDDEIREKLKSLIEPQTLRRMKSDVAALPPKTERDDCKQIPLSRLQRDLYSGLMASYSKKPASERGTAMLGALHQLRMICAHPLQIDPRQPREESPKVEWLLKSLKQIQERQEKVIIFTELRDIQIFLRRLIQEFFGLPVDTVNGDTASTSQSGVTRQKIIDQFQAKPGFNVIIMSPVAVGFGVNVQKANHVIHYTRCWNPAKEDQATDRAYRIGQENEVFVYYPSVYATDIETFEVKLDRLLNGKRKLAKDILSPGSGISDKELAAGLLGTVEEIEGGHNYVTEWESISQSLRESHSWTCQECNVRLSQGNLKQYLHVHHINHVKDDNVPSNLKVLCVRCHAEQPGHDHMKSQMDYANFINMNLR